MLSKYGKTLLFQTKDELGPIEVVEDKGIRYLHFGTPAIQSSHDTSANQPLHLPYAQMLMLSLLFIPRPSRVLLLGMGTGAIASFLQKQFPHCFLQGVELRPKVIEVAQEFFSFKAGPLNAIHYGDALEYVQAPPSSPFDLIIVDLYLGEKMAEAVGERGFFSQCRKCLTPQGVLGWNLWKDSAPHLLKSSLTHLTHAFGNSRILIPANEEEVVLLTLPTPLQDYSFLELAQKATALQESSQVPLATIWEQITRGTYPSCLS